MWCGYEWGLGKTEVDGLQCWVPDLLERSGLEFTEADGFFRLTVEGKEFDLVAPRFSPRPAQDVMSADEYAFLLRSHGVSHDWQFRQKPANRRAWRLADEDLKHEWRQISGAASQRLGQSSSLAALVAAVRSLGELTFAQRAWLQAPEAPPLECWPLASPSEFSFMPSVERVECRLEVLLLAALRANEFVPHASDFFQWRSSNARSCSGRHNVRRCGAESANGFTVLPPHSSPSIMRHEPCARACCLERSFTTSTRPKTSSASHLDPQTGMPCGRLAFMQASPGSSNRSAKSFGVCGCWHEGPYR